MITCPQCGRLTVEGAFCSRCGAELESVLPHRSPVADSFERDGGTPAFGQKPDVVASEPHLSRPELRHPEFHRAVEDGRPLHVQTEIVCDGIPGEDSISNGVPTLEIDQTCRLYENMNGTLRFRFDPQSGGVPVEGVKFVFTNDGCQKSPHYEKRRMATATEFLVQFPSQSVGFPVWNVSIVYYAARQKYELAGQFLIQVKPIESRKRGADNFNINIQTNIGSVGHASDVTVNQRGVDGLAKMMEESDVWLEMDRIQSSTQRQWARIPLSDDNRVALLPPMPASARADRIGIDLGSMRLTFIANRTVKLGRKKELNDIALQPIKGMSEMEYLPYRKISREHCFFEMGGQSAMIYDGHRDEAHVIVPSSGGTFWNGERLQAPVSISAGTTGVVSFGGVAFGDNLAMDVKVCSPSAACENCPYAEKRWCDESRRPSLVLSRRDGVSEKFIALWSCFNLGDADPAYNGVFVFRKDGAFAYRAGGRSGWLVPGTSVQTDFGKATIQ